MATAWQRQLQTSMAAEWLRQSRLASLPPIVASSFTCAAVMYPADLLKALRMGASPDVSSRSLVSSFHARYGVRGFFTQGVAPEVARAGLMRCIKFFCETTRHPTHAHTRLPATRTERSTLVAGFPLAHEAVWGIKESKGTPSTKALAGAVCTVPEVLCIMPLEVVKVGLQLDKSNAFKGSSAAVLAFMRQRYSWRGLYVGWVGVQMRQSSWTAVYFGSLQSFQDATNAALAYVAPERAGSMTKLSQLIAGFAAGFAGALFNVPADLIRTNVQRQALAGMAAGGAGAQREALAVPFFAFGEFLSTGRQIAARSGVGGLWTGLTWKAVHLGGSGALMAALLPVFKQYM
jgi:solute carrier family 25 2-oxodicarboxylate transporter 21